MRVLCLGEVASRILNQILLHGDEYMNLPVREQMYYVGCRRIQTFREARRELEIGGFVELVLRVGCETRMVVVGGNVPIDVINNNSYIYVPLTDSVVGNDIPSTNGHYHPTREVLPLTRSVSTQPLTESVTPNAKCEEYPKQEVLVVTESVRGIRELCREVDDMDDSGELSDRNSPVQKRRKAQIPLGVRMYTELYPDDNPPVDETVKLWLSMIGNSASLLYEFLLENKKMRPDVSSRKSFITNCLKKISKRDKLPPINTTSQDLPAPKHYEGDLIELTQEDREKRERAKKQALRTWGKDDE